MSDYKISGSGTICGGEYTAIEASGSTHLDGDIKCTSMRTSGSCHGKANLCCEGAIHSSGSFSCEGDVKAQEMHSSGSTTCSSFSGGVLSCSGVFRCLGKMDAERVDASGAFHCGNLEAETLKLSGAINVDGQINTGEVDIRLASTLCCRAGSVVGGKISIRPEARGFFRLFHIGSFCTELIEGDELTLDSVEADTVRAENVRVGKGCRIKRLEYSGNAEIDPAAVVGESIKL